MRPRLLLLALVFGGGSMLMAPSGVEACSCIEQNIEGARAAATAVFRGRILRFETIGGESHAVFQVERIWKGRVTRTVQVRADVGTLCPPHLVVGQTLIVYAVGPADALRIDACSRTAFSSGDARSLGRSHRPTLD